MFIRVLTTAILSASVVGLVSAAPNTSAAAGDYFKDKTVTVVVPSGSGGTFHIYCQLVQRNIGRHIPGNPKTIIQNRPGAGGVKSLRYMTTAAPRDGTMIAMINPGTTMTPILRPKMGYDATKLQ
jgi:tripartite-type tricarboxylate transporter receptor subunit TctC